MPAIAASLVASCDALCPSELAQSSLWEHVLWALFLTLQPVAWVCAGASGELEHAQLVH